jgi:type III secretion protein R
MGIFPDFIFIAALLITFALVPFMAVLVTSYTKIVIVLGLLRMAIGTQQTPPNLVINGIAIVMSLFIMAPIALKAQEAIEKQMSTNSSKGSQGDKASPTFQDFLKARDAVLPPLREFLKKNTRERELQFFMKTASTLWPPEVAQKATNDDLLILIPAFTISELSEAFMIGFVIYLVFVVVDLVVATVLLSMGMAMISPTTISIPFKLLLFVALDGWSRLLQGLVISYAK